MDLKTLLDHHKFNVVIQRLSHQLLENHPDFANSAIIGIQPRGTLLSDRIVANLNKLLKTKICYGKLDITFYRDDFNSGGQIHIPNKTEIEFSLEDKKVILIDDVLFTGRTVRSAMDALVDFGRPQKVELLTLIDRRYRRELPIQADYVGLVIDSMISQKVKVYWNEKDEKDEVVLIDN
ncbi:MAG: bifunctional pyr operon transcriptional regulator/uracil phosphoribosyltransferase PyrR [Bacteroidetes bacterium]|nr:bifunctional pyr operon transcriptional regulator/uracil phosphoribosyltransferase PyrR [Bacteroidota bacterium]